MVNVYLLFLMGLHITFSPIDKLKKLDNSQINKQLIFVFALKTTR